MFFGHFFSKFDILCFIARFEKIKYRSKDPRSNEKYVKYMIQQICSLTNEEYDEEVDDEEYISLYFDTCTFKKFVYIRDKRGQFDGGPQCTHFIDDNPNYFIGTNKASERSYIYHIFEKMKDYKLEYFD